MRDRPDKPLVVKCNFDRHSKKINFPSARNCSYPVLRKKVEQCFSLYAQSYMIAYADDDGEVNDINNDEDLTEAIKYFQAGNDDAPSSSTASILSGRSFGSRKITLRINITVDYDGPSLSDSSSLASMDEFNGRNSSQVSLSFPSSTVDLDDDSVTVSSKDVGASPSITIEHHSSQPEASAQGTLQRNRDLPLPVDSGEAVQLYTSTGEAEFAPNQVQRSARNKYSEDPSAVLQRLKLEEAQEFVSAHSRDHILMGVHRGAEWLRDQNVRTFETIFNASSAPTETDSLRPSLEEESVSQLDGSLALKRWPSGKYYYSYIAAAASTTSHPGCDEVHSLPDTFASAEDTSIRNGRPVFDWLATQQIHPQDSKPGPSTGEALNDALLDIYAISTLAEPPEDILTACSECGIPIKAIRYVCSTCGEKLPMSCSVNAYPPSQSPLFPPAPFQGSLMSPASSRIAVHQKCLPSPQPSLLSPLSSVTLIAQPDRSGSNSLHGGKGFELCRDCITSAGLNHALDFSLSPSYSSSGFSSPSSPEDTQWALSQRRRTAPKEKGKPRHAYVEKLWGLNGWEDVGQDDHTTRTCSICKTLIFKQRYKCGVCAQFLLCRACYNSVHEYHPSHFFLVMPERSVSAPACLPTTPPLGQEEQSLKHPGVTCHHCMRDILGARFHCAICDMVDICSSCESAGLPGNLDSSDGGHNSSHIMIKIPYPLETDEVQIAQRNAHRLWTGRDEQMVHGNAPRSSNAASAHSVYAGTIVASTSRSSHPLDSSAALKGQENHEMHCSGCSKLIVGVRFQCANCPSSPITYSLCELCEVKSHLIHDPMHAFFKLPRPLKRRIESPFPLLPKLYKEPAGPPPGAGETTQLKAYLRHTYALCDRCVVNIQGAWFRCVYCGKDLCDDCEEVDTHDDAHVFLVLKSTVDMQLFRNLTDLENPSEKPLIPYKVY